MEKTLKIDINEGRISTGMEVLALRIPFIFFQVSSLSV
jgi:hypothetical protein